MTYAGTFSDTYSIKEILDTVSVRRDANKSEEKLPALTVQYLR